MKLKSFFLSLVFLVTLCIICSFNNSVERNQYTNLYFQKTNSFDESLKSLSKLLIQSKDTSEATIAQIKHQISTCRYQLKAIDFWLRYLEPVSYKKINGPLPVEWETEVFEKYEMPYKRYGAGLTLAEMYLSEKDIKMDSLIQLIEIAESTLQIFNSDSITVSLDSYHHFFLCNRLFILNLGAIYTTGFECPDTDEVIPELNGMLKSVLEIYKTYNQTFNQNLISSSYMELYQHAIQFVQNQSGNFELFDHYTFIRDYINPLFVLNQQMIRNYKVVSKSYNDFSLNDHCNSLFDKSLYNGQLTKGVYFLVNDEKILSEIKQTGKQLFYDPLLSKNGLRSCASCHKPTQYFADTSITTPFQFNHNGHLERNAPSLTNVVYNHLLMLDGKHISLTNQAKDVTTNPLEMASTESEIVEKMLSCKDYKRAFNKFLPYTRFQKSISFEQIASAITLYYSDFSNYLSPFDDAMNGNGSVDTTIIKGFNLFMSKAQCATCHFVPQFNGVKPPYISSEFEVLGVPEDTTFKIISNDKGRYLVNPATETMNAFRTGSIRNASQTKPYMHNGVFNTLTEVIDFYDAGGGVGKKLRIENQTLSSDSIHLTPYEKKALISFVESLTEKIKFDSPPMSLPLSSDKNLNKRKVGGEY